MSKLAYAFSGSLAAIALAALLSGTPGAFAFDSGGSTTATKTCAKGYVWSDKKNACVKATSGLVPDREVTQQARALALAGQYDAAIILLDGVQTKDSIALTYLGYSYRKLGNLDRGVQFYQAALAIDPNNVDTREYLGEGYVSAGRLDLARVELAKVESLCGTDCEEYRALAAAVNGNAAQ